MSMQQSGFLAAEKTLNIVGRQTELELIRNAIYHPDNSLQVVLVRGPAESEARGEPEGGYGKTRLLEAVRENVSGQWASLGDVIVSDPVDLIDIRLHAMSNFLRAVRDSFLRRAAFFAYDEAYDRYKRLLSQAAEYRYVREAAEETVKAFLSDYRENAAQRRMVWLLDTVEQLTIAASDWLIERGLLTQDDMSTRAQAWLIRHIQEGALPNTTLLLAGRGRDGASFFKAIASAVKEAQGKVELVDVRTEPFSAEETHEYFEVLADEYAQRAQETGAGSEAAAYSRVAKVLLDLGNRPETTKVFWLYTGGVPVRLALFTELLIEDRSIPLPFQLPWEKAVQEVKTDDPRKTTPELELTQWRIEDRLINLLFVPGDLRSRILRTLVRTRRGLTAEQLHFVLDNKEGLTPEVWDKVTDNKRIQEIDDQLRRMRSLFLVKQRPAGWQLWEEEPIRGAERRGLQDEIYRIYAEHMAPHADPIDDRMQRIWKMLSEDERERYGRNREDEKRARAQLYQQLRAWAKNQYEKFQKQQREYQDADERDLRLATVNPAELHLIRFRDLGETERRKRAAIRDIIDELELEQMYYALLLDPAQGLNDVHTEVADAKAWANNEEADSLVQAEMWHILKDDYAFKFVDLEIRPPIRERGETPLYVLRRAAQQGDVARWIRRFEYRKEYQRAIQFADAIEREIGQLKQGDEQQRHDWAGWNHALARGERLCWRKYAQILKGEDLPEAIQSLEAMVSDLEKLALCTTQEIAIPKEIAYSGRDERGFKGADDPDPTKRVPYHPAFIRLKRVISATYNALGYGCATLGRARKAVEYYGKALHYTRDAGVPALRANALNNLSRPLSNMGRHRAVRVCRDGLELRKRLGADVPIAYSHNTLALIYNDRNRPEDAWIEAAKAVAYFRRAEEPRGLGLALLQLGEALRRMAWQARAGSVQPADPDRIHSVAESLLTEARDLFTSPEYNLDEPVRLVEARIELGCLFRDRIWAIEKDEPSPRWRRYYREAQSYLEGAIHEADSRGFKKHALDGRVNLAWTHFYAEQFEEAEKALQAAEATVDEDYFIRPISSEKPGGFVPNPADRDESYVFPQLSKIYGLRGTMALKQFTLRVQQLAIEHPEDSREQRHRRVHADSEADRSLQRAAEAYTLGTAYAQLYSPRAYSLSALYDGLYSYLKKFNATELTDFYRHTREQRRHYPADQIKANIEDLGNVVQFVQEVAGLYDDVLNRAGDQ